MERLQKVMAHAGIASRRKCEQLILDGVVTVNGKTVTELGIKVSPKDRIEVRGVPLQQEEKVYYLFYKPRGVISAVSDDKGRRVVTDFFPENEKRIYPVGRLDYDTSGALLMTNDGEFANALMHPKFKVDKVYRAKVKGIADKKLLKPIAYGMKLDGKMTAPAYYEILSTNEKNGTSIVEITLHEGRYHQVKRMLEACHLPVMKLKRERYGQLTLDGLREGEYRRLTPKEVQQMYYSAQQMQ